MHADAVTWSPVQWTSLTAGREHGGPEDVCLYIKLTKYGGSVGHEPGEMMAWC